MLKDGIEKKNQPKKKDQCQPRLAFQTHDSVLKIGNNNKKMKTKFEKKKLKGQFIVLD